MRRRISKSQPTRGDVHVNTPLTNISIAFLQDQRNFISSRAFPNVPVDKQSDRYYTYDRGDFFRDDMVERAPGTESAGGGYDLDNTPTYFAKVYAYHKDIDDDVRANSDSVLNPDRDATSFLTHKALIKRETLWMSKYFVGGVWTNDWDGVAAGPVGNQVLQWNDANSTPIEDLRAGISRVGKTTGYRPNKLVLGQEVWDVLQDHPDIVDRVKYGQTAGKPAMVTMEAVAQLLGIEEILVSSAVKNSAVEGAADSNDYIAGKKALLVYAPPNPGLLIPSGGYTFSWRSRVGAGPEGNRIKRFRMDHLNSDRVEIEMAFDQKLVAADLGQFYDTIIA